MAVLAATHLSTATLSQLPWLAMAGTTGHDSIVPQYCYISGALCDLQAVFPAACQQGTLYL